MWRITYAVLSGLLLIAASTATVMAESHEVAGTSSGGTTATTPVVTTPPSTGVGTIVEQMPSFVLVAVMALAGVFAMLALTTVWQRQRI